MSLTDTTAPARAPTGAQARAFNWLKARGGDGMFDKNGVLLAQGELAPFMRSTWSALREQGFVEFYSLSAIKRRGRVRII